MMPFGQFNSVLISVSENYPLTKVITYQFALVYQKTVTSFEVAVFFFYPVKREHRSYQNAGQHEIRNAAPELMLRGGCVIGTYSAFQVILPP